MSKMRPEEKRGGYTGSKPAVKPKPPKSSGANVTPKSKKA
jgi:hypothetical protein